MIDRCESYRRFSCVFNRSSSTATTLRACYGHLGNLQRLCSACCLLLRALSADLPESAVFYLISRHSIALEQVSTVPSCYLSHPRVYRGLIFPDSLTTVFVPLVRRPGDGHRSKDGHGTTITLPAEHAPDIAGSGRGFCVRLRGWA